MTHVHTNGEGLQVRDLIAELQRHHPGDRTTVAEVRWSAGRVYLVPTHEWDEADAEQKAETARKEMERWRGLAASERAQYAHLLRQVEKAQAIMRRVKVLKRQRPLP